MSEATISKKLKQLPPEARKQARDFVDFLYQRYVKSDKKKKSGKNSIAESSFFGIWEEREDLKDSSEWVRNVRKSQWPDS